MQAAVVAAVVAVVAAPEVSHPATVPPSASITRPAAPGASRLLHFG